MSPDSYGVREPYFRLRSMRSDLLETYANSVGHEVGSSRGS